MQEDAERDADDKTKVFGFVTANVHGKPPSNCTAQETPPKEGGFGNAIFVSNCQEFIKCKKHESQEVN